MVLTKRTTISLTQFLGVLSPIKVSLLLQKYDISTNNVNNLSVVSDALLRADNDNLGKLINEVVVTKKSLKSEVTPKLIFKERWQDLTQCLLLDGYRVDKNSITRCEPSLEGAEPIEDDLSKELEKSNLPQWKEIKKHIDDSADDFKKGASGYNGCLSNLRIAYETLVIGIAENKGYKKINDGKDWGHSLSYLREKNFMNIKEEKALASVYTLISDASHIPLGFTEEEYVRFGRNLATSMCYFVIKLFNGKGGGVKESKPLPF